MAAPVQYAPVPPVPTRKPSGLAVASLVLGILAVVFSILPIVNIISIILGIIGLVLGIVGIFKSQRVMSIFGTVLSAVGIVVAIAVSAAAANAINNLPQAPVQNDTPAQNVVPAPNGAPADNNGPGLVEGAGKDVFEYKVSAGSGEVTFTSFSGNGMSSSSGHVTGSWHKTVKVGQDEIFAPTLAVTNGEASGKVTCDIVKNGKSVSHNVASGPYATAMCNK